MQNQASAKSPSTQLVRRAVSARALACAFVLLTSLVAAAPAAQAQWWPFGGQEEERRPPVPREPVRRPEAIPAPIPPQAGGGPAPSAGGGSRSPICLQLEQRLVQESQKGNQTRDQLPRIEAELRNVDRAYHIGSQQLDQSCYEVFLFTKSFRNTPQCKELAKQVDVSKRRLAELEAQRQDIAGSSGRSYQDDIVRELARNNCGANYADQARRRDGGVWQDEESVSGNSWAPQSTGVATYRTLCVRLCDGFYFPVSFSTLPSHFAQDAEVCSSKCAAPTELYYYQNPGGSVDQSVSLKGQEAYTKLKVAFRYRKEYVNGCSCKEAEYAAPEGSDKKAEGGESKTKTSASPPRRADAGEAAAPVTTGSTAAAPPATAPVVSKRAPAAAAPAAPAPSSSVDGGWAPQQ